MKLISEMVLLFSLQASAGFLSEQKAAMDMIRNTEKMSVLFAAHHKTGSSLAKLLVRMLSTTIDVETTELLHVWNWDWESHQQSYRSLGNLKIVHFVRDPMAQIVSAYNYHMQGSEPWEFTWDLRTRYERRVLNCSENSTIFIDCLRSKDMYDGLITQVMMNLYYPTRGHFVNFLPAMVLEYQSLELLPELAFNVCLEEFKADFEGTLMRICDFIGICGDIEKLTSLMVEGCRKGGCRIASKTEKKLECRQTRHWGAVCPDLRNSTPLFEYRNLNECLKKCQRLKHKCRTVVENKENKCRLYEETCVEWQRSKITPNLFVVRSQTCYDLPDFEVAAVDDLYTALEKRPLLKKQIEGLSMQMKCRAFDKSLPVEKFYLPSVVPSDFKITVSIVLLFLLTWTLLYYAIRKMNSSRKSTTTFGRENF